MPRKLNDGQWHHVQLSNVNKMLNIQVHIGGDAGQLVQENIKLPRRLNAANVMYVGGVADGSHMLPMELMSKLVEFKGCIRRFKVNNATQDLARTGRHFNVGQCFPKVEKGSFFPGDAYAIYSKFVTTTIFHLIHSSFTLHFVFVPQSASSMLENF